jgi:conjugative relaxase-like TrwC/TraI family protein
MYRITLNSSVAGAKTYFRNGDYLSEGQERPGRWGGRAAAMLGLSGEVLQRDWDLLCENRDPRSGESLAARRNADRRVGYDMTWSAGKSFSLLYAMTRDQRLLEAFERSVDSTMREVEQQMQTRVRRGGKNENRTTGRMVWGAYTHFTGRPVDGIPDPQLHMHCFCFNTTFDDVEQRWKAGQFGDIKRDAPFYEAVFRSKLAQEMVDLGLPVQRTKDGWELEGFDRSTLAKFSRRTALIEKIAMENGITSEVEKAELGAKTREKKDKSLTMIQLQQVWQSWLDADEKQSLREVVGRIGGEPVPQSPSAAKEAVDHAISHCFERESVVPERTFLRESLRRSYGQATREAVERRSQESSLIRADLDGRKMVTTPSMLEIESSVIRFAREGRGTCEPLGHENQGITRQWLSDEQQRAVRHIWNSTDRVMILHGAAGVGKSKSLIEAVEGIEANGRKVFAFAPSTTASRVALRNEGIADADTVARLLADKQLQQRVQGQVLLIDEAGMMGIRDTQQVFQLAQQADARVILCGDRRQHHSVAAGDSLALLEDQAGVIPAEIVQVRRQEGQYRQAVMALSEGRMAEAFEMLDALNAIKEAPAEERYPAIAREYVESVQAGKSTLVVCPTHAEGNVAARHIRSELKDAGMLGLEERQFQTLVNLNLTEAERADAVNLTAGDVLEYHQNAKGRKKGERIVVGDLPVPSDQSDRYTAYRSRMISLASGDLVRLTKNGTSANGRQLHNGDICTVDQFTKTGDIQLNNGVVLSKDWGHLSLGYVVTSHASQSLTREKLIAVMGSKSFPAVSKEQTYVTYSRGAKEISIYTDDRDGLLEAASYSDSRLSATDLMAEREHRIRIIETERQTQTRPAAERVREERTYER